VNGNAFTIGLLVLGGLGLALMGWAVFNRKPPATPLPSLDEWFRRWQVQHHAPDVDPSKTTLLRWFLTTTFTLARPLARFGISPTAVTLGGLWLSVAVPVVALRSPGAAALLCLLSATLDGVDGAVAGLSNRASRVGFVLDSFVDRLAEIAFFAALVVAGGHLWSAASAWAGVVLLEYVRARAANAGLDEIGVVTVAERPTRVLCVVFGLVGCAVAPQSAGWIADASGVISALTTVVGLIQLGRLVTQRLSDHHRE
jgi:phosphatidylglycerophosphate synthase